MADMSMLAQIPFPTSGLPLAVVSPHFHRPAPPTGLHKTPLIPLEQLCGMQTELEGRDGAKFPPLASELQTAPQHTGAQTLWDFCLMSQLVLASSFGLVPPHPASPESPALVNR